MTSCSVRKAWNASRSVRRRALMSRRFVVTAGRELFGGSGSVGSNDLTVSKSSGSHMGDMLRGWLLWSVSGVVESDRWGLCIHQVCASVVDKRAADRPPFRLMPIL
jgi:hypothetical protein